MRARAAFLLVLSLLLSCRSLKEGDPIHFESAPLFGKVYDRDNRPCASVALRLDGAVSSSSDIDGRFVFLELKPGPHRLTATLPDHEALEVSFEFRARTQVLFLSMTSFDQLLAQAQDSLDQGSWTEARSLLDRAAAIRAADPLLIYLQAVLDFHRGDPAAAAHRLEELAVVHGTPPVHLFLADLYQYWLDRPDLARTALARYLEQEDDPEVRIRLQGLSAAE